jgi:UDP-glucose 4-epimerase
VLRFVVTRDGLSTRIPRHQTAEARLRIEGNKFVVTGGFGLVGSHIADQLLAAGASGVTLCDNGAVGDAQTVAHLRDNPRVKLLQGDILRINEMLDALEGVSGVFHTAYFITIPLAKNLWTGMDVNVRGLMNVLEACRVRGVKKIVYTSSIATYGNAGDGAITEESPFVGYGVQPTPALYGIGKLMAEQLCAFYKQRHGLDYVAARVSTIYGERQHARGLNVVPVVEAYEQARRGVAPMMRLDPAEVHDYIYVGDVARAHVMAMASDISGEAFTIASGKPTRFDELIRATLKACGAPFEATFEEDTTRMRSAKAAQNRYSVDKAKTMLGWEPQVSLEEGLRRLVAWRDGATSSTAAKG